MSDLAESGDYGFVIAAFFILFIISLYIGTLIEHLNIKFLHESGISIFLGLLVGLIIYLIDNDQEISFKQYQFFYLILPPIIFAGGYNLKKNKFFKHIKYILTFGFISTIINFVLMTFLLWLWSKWDGISVDIKGDLSMDASINDELGQPKKGDILHLHIQEIMFICATLSASDAVAPLALLNQDENPKLFSCIFGEGTMNDIVAIILFSAVEKVSTSESESLALSAKNIGKMILTFAITIGASVLFGIAGGAFSSLVLKWNRFIRHSHIHEMCMLFLVGLVAFAIPQALEYSGIMSILIASIMMRHYAYYNLSGETQKLFGQFLEAIAHLLEGFLFIYMGVTCFISKSAWSFSLIGGLMVCLIIARFFAVFALSAILTYIGRCMKRESFWDIDFCELTLIFTAGLIRGSVAIGLICELPEDEQHGKLVITSVFGVVVLTSGVLGQVMGKYIEMVQNIRKRIYPERALRYEEFIEADKSVVQDVSQAHEAANASLLEKEKTKSVFSYWKWFDNKYLKPAFIYNFLERRKANYFREMMPSVAPQDQQSVTSQSFVQRASSFRPSTNHMIQNRLSQNYHNKNLQKMHTEYQNIMKNKVLTEDEKQQQLEKIEEEMEGDIEYKTTYMENAIKLDLDEENQYIFDSDEEEMYEQIKREFALKIKKEN